MLEARGRVMAVRGRAWAAAVGVPASWTADPELAADWTCWTWLTSVCTAAGTAVVGDEYGLSSFCSGSWVWE